MLRCPLTAVACAGSVVSVLPGINARKLSSSFILTVTVSSFCITIRVFKMKIVLGFPGDPSLPM